MGVRVCVFWASQVSFGLLLCFLLFVEALGGERRSLAGCLCVCGKKAAVKVIHRAVSRDPGPKLITTSTHFWIPMTESIELRPPDGAQQSRCDCNFSLLRPSATTPRFAWPSVIGTEMCSWSYIQSMTKSDWVQLQTRSPGPFVWLWAAVLKTERHVGIYGNKLQQRWTLGCSDSGCHIFLTDSVCYILPTILTNQEQCLC